QTWAWVNVVVKPGKKNIPPVAKTKGYRSVAILPETSTTIDGSPSYDEDGKIIKWEWDQVKGPTKARIGSPSSAKTKIYDMDKVGKYRFRLKVFDDRGAERWVWINVIVAKAGKLNILPVADTKGYKRIVTLPKTTTTIDGSPSYDEDGRIVKWKWDQ